MGGYFTHTVDFDSVYVYCVSLHEPLLLRPVGRLTHFPTKLFFSSGRNSSLRWFVQ